MNKNKIIKLDTVVKFEGQTIKELTMREPKVKDMLIAQSESGATEAETEVLVMATLTSHPREIIEELSMKDYAKLQEVYQSFLV